MRNEIIKLVENTFILKYKLPYKLVNKTSLTTLNDYCFDSNDRAVSEVIYNSIIDYSLNEIEIDLRNLNKEQLYSVENRLRYDNEMDLESQLKYGFFGETLLNIILSVFFHTKKIIAKGHFYSPIERSEPKGYDSFHFVENYDGVEFWFGESKMYVSLGNAITSILNNINEALSNKYYKRNIRAILNRNNDLDETSCSPLFNNLLSKLKRENMEVVLDELKRNNVKIVYPILLVYNELTENFDKKIENTLSVIESRIKKYVIKNEILAEILFILVPVIDVINIKKEVLEWISKQKSII